MHGGLYCLHDCMDSRIDHSVVVRIGVIVVRIGVIVVVAGVVAVVVIG